MGGAIKGLKEPRVYWGVGVSPGIAIGKARILEQGKIEIKRYRLKRDSIPEEKERFERAVSQVEQQLESLLGEIPEELKEHAGIFKAHLMMLRDRMVYDNTLALIEKEGINAEWALKKTLNQIKEAFSRIRDDFIRERFSDVEDVIKRVQLTLCGESVDTESDGEGPVILIAKDLSPADTVQIDPQVVKGFVTEKGSRTSHTAIVARSLGIPAVVGVEGVLENVFSGETVIVDGLCGECVVTDDEELIGKYREKQKAFSKYSSDVINISHLPAETRDGFRVNIKANIEMPDEVSMVITHGAEGVGLFRTEFLYLQKKELPNEDELFRAYSDIVRRLAPYPVTIRTLDIGGDKFLSTVPLSDEINPALGLRAIRLCLKEPKLFKTQLRAILRASALGEVRILLPLISGRGEILQAKALLREAMDELRDRKMSFDEGIKVGIMIEVPTAVMLADILAQEVDFFSIGTNDLIQYSLAIDRVNERVAHLYEPLHPAILRMLYKTIEAAHSQGIEVAVCGEMAGEPMYVPVLLGMEVDELSMNAIVVPRIKKMIRSIDHDSCKDLLMELLEETTAKAIRKRLLKFLSTHYPEEFSPEKGLYCDLVAIRKKDGEGNE